MGPRGVIDFGLIAQQSGEIFRALGLTLGMWLAGGLGALVLGFGVAVARRYGPRALATGLGFYVELMRGTPFLIQLFLLYYGGPSIGLALDPVPAGLIGLSVYGAAYFSEIFRSGFDAVPTGHIEAAQCAGMSGMQIIRRILIPEMAMLVLPALINMMVILLKETAVLSLITVQELTMVIGVLGSQNFAFMTAMALLALFYWGLVELSGFLGHLAEHRLSRFRFTGT